MISFTYNNLNHFALFLIFAILFQSCVVYHKQPATVSQAIEHDKQPERIIPYRVKVIMKNEKRLVFDSLYCKNGDLYGLKIKKKYLDNPNMGEIQIRENDIKEIHLLNRKGSRTVSILLSITIIGLTIGVIIWAGKWMEDFRKGWN